MGSTTVFVVAVLIFKPLQLLGWWTTTEAAQPWIYESSKGKDGDKEPTVRFEVKDGGVVGGACECVSDEAVVTVESLCKDVPAGETVGIYRAGTEGKENDDFVGFIHMFGTGGGSGVRAGEKEK